ncbi:MAG: type IV toxin-antitoxin system AbiEi family antitoxin domain-containing protein [Acidimicrobiia bacterium]
MREVTLARTARRRHGLFTLADAIAAGFSRPAVRRRVRDGTWEEVEPRVFRVGASTALTWIQAVAALALSTGGVASGRSAATLHGLLDPPVHPSVTVYRLRRTASTSPDPRVHSTDTLDPEDVTLVAAIRSMSVARTLIDVLPVVSRSRGEQAIDRALTRGMVTSAELRQRAEALAAPRRSGCRIVLRLLTQRSAGADGLRNEWEARVLRALAGAGLPEPLPDYEIVVDGRQRFLDFAWPEHRVAVEFDGFEPHSHRRVFDDDRVRQNGLVAMGWQVYRLTATSLRRDPGRALAPIAAALSKR